MINFLYSLLHQLYFFRNVDVDFEDVIDSVAVLKKPQKINAKGVYKLKEEL